MLSFVTLIIYVGCTFLRPQEWVPGLIGKPLINISAMATFFFLLLERFAYAKEGFLKVPQNKLILGMYFAVLMSHIIHTYFGGLMAAFQSFLVIFLLFFLLLNGINTELKFKTTVWFIIFCITLLVQQGVYQINNGYGWAGQELTIQLDGIRINWIGIFSDPNDLALTFVLAMGILLAFLLGRTGLFMKIFSGGLMTVLFYGLYLTNSRGGLLALMTTVYFFIVRRTGKFVLGGIIGGALAAGVFVLGPSRMGLLSTAESSAYSRVELWYQGILMIKSNPLFGVGYDMFTDHLPQTAHNSFILAGAELGLIGLYFWMALIYASFKGMSIVQTNNKKLYNYALGVQSSLVGFCAAAFFLSRTYVIIPYFLFALAGSLMHVAKQKDKSLDFSFTKQDRKITLGLSIAVLALSYAVIKLGI